jgi:hypothetical protein
MTPHNNQSKQLSLGRVFATPGALEAIAESNETPADFLHRHAHLDWGCVSPEDQRANDHALESGLRILSAYDTQQGTRIWIITEAADQSGTRPATTILLPQEY